MKSLNLAIERIVVEGLPTIGQRQFVRALEERLRDFAESGIAREFAGNRRKRIHLLSAGQLRPGATPAQAAMQVANCIQQVLGANSANESFSGLGPIGSRQAKRNV
jgi:hypothetical protein